MLHAYHKCCTNGTCNVFMWQSSSKHQIVWIKKVKTVYKKTTLSLNGDSVYFFVKHGLVKVLQGSIWYISWLLLGIYVALYHATNKIIVAWILHNYKRHLLILQISFGLLLWLGAVVHSGFYRHAGSLIRLLRSLGTIQKCQCFHEWPKRCFVGRWGQWK